MLLRLCGPSLPGTLNVWHGVVGLLLHPELQVLRHQH